MTLKAGTTAGELGCCGRLVKIRQSLFHPADTPPMSCSHEQITQISSRVYELALIMISIILISDLWKRDNQRSIEKSRSFVAINKEQDRTHIR